MRLKNLFFFFRGKPVSFSWCALVQSMKYNDFFFFKDSFSVSNGNVELSVEFVGSVSL